MKKIACLECDLLLDEPILNSHQSAYCPRCGCLITAKSSNCLQYSLAFSAAAVMFMLLANAFPFMTFEAQGQKQVMNLWQCAWALYQYKQSLLGALVLTFMIIVPVVIASALLYLLYPMIFRRKLVAAAMPIARMIFKAKPWSMAEVFLLGVLVSLTKVATLAYVELNVAFWAYILFVVSLTAALSNLDKYRFWHYVAKVKRCQHLH